MFHSKSKSNKIQTKEELKNNIDEKGKNNSTNEYISTTANQISSTNDDFGLNLSNDETIGKLSSLFYEQDNNDKIVNISKLDESLNYNIKNSNRDEHNQKYQYSNSNFELNININEQDSNPVINVSCLESQSKEQESNNKDDLYNINNSINASSNMNIVEKNQNNIIEKKDEIFMIRRRKKIDKRNMIILILVFVLIIFSLIIIFLFYLILK